MSDTESLCLFAAEPLDRASDRRADPQWIAARLADPDTYLIPLYKGDPLVVGGKAGFLSAAARSEMPSATPTVFLGVGGGRAHFAVDVSAAPTAERAPFADVGSYMALREAAGVLGESDLAILGQARWLLDWHRRHAFCAVCGSPTEIGEGGAKRLCPRCQAEHFPRTDPVAIVLAIYGDSCLLGRSPRFPPGFLSALAGFVEAAETPEACAARELKEEAGVTLTRVAYQFSQPWPFPSSLMMGFLADARDRTLTLDPKEIEEARWVTKDQVRRYLAGDRPGDFFLPPRFTIARRLIESWVAG